jgi:hypothetical protein
MQHLDDEELFHELNGRHHEEAGADAIYEVHQAPRSLDSHSDDLPNMQIAGATYEIAV